MQAFY